MKHTNLNSSDAKWLDMIHWKLETAIEEGDLLTVEELEQQLERRLNRMFSRPNHPKRD